MKKLSMLHKTNGSKPTRSICVCTHVGDCPNSDHGDSKLELGHGPCKVKDCNCKRFVWKGFMP